MKILMLSADPSILVRDSRSNARMRGYAGQFEQLHVVVACRRPRSPDIQGGLFTYPASSRGSLRRLLRTLFKGWVLCRTVCPDLVSTQDPDLLGLTGYLLARLFHLPLQVQVHTDLFSPYYRSASWKERVRLLVARFVLPRASCIRAVSDHIEAALADELAIPKSRISVLPMYTDAQAIERADRMAWVEERLRGHTLKLMAAGRFIDREKGFSLLLRAYADVVHLLPQPVLALVGEGPDWTLYEAMIRSLELSDRVWLVPWQANIFSYMKSFDIYLNPSNFEGWGRGCIEAAAAGLAVITTDVGVASSLFTNGLDARIIPVKDRSALTQAILELGSNPEFRMRMTRAGQNTVQSLFHLSWDRYCQEFRDEIERCRNASSGS